MVLPAALATDDLLTEAEVSQVLGMPVRASASNDPFHTGTVFRGGGVSVRLVLTKFRGPDRAVARRPGRPLPGVGDEAWLLSGGRTLVMRAGPTQAMLIAMNLPPSECEPALTLLAQILAPKLARVAAVPR